MKGLDFGSTPEGSSMNLHPHPCFVWMKVGYSESIPWRKVPLTKQRNVDLTTDGLWAMPLNTRGEQVKKSQVAGLAKGEKRRLHQKKW